MSQNTETLRGSFDTAQDVHVRVPGDPSETNLGELLHELDVAALPQIPNVSYENHLVEVRLGIASSLYAAIRHKHAPTAAHSLRVALGCSSWAFARGHGSAGARRIGSGGAAARHRQDRSARSVAVQARRAGQGRSQAGRSVSPHRAQHSVQLLRLDGDPGNHSPLGRTGTTARAANTRWWATTFRKARECWPSSTRSTR